MFSYFRISNHDINDRLLKTCKCSPSLRQNTPKNLLNKYNMTSNGLANWPFWYSYSYFQYNIILVYFRFCSFCLASSCTFLTKTALQADKPPPFLQWSVPIWECSMILLLQPTLARNGGDNASFNLSTTLLFVGKD